MDFPTHILVTPIDVETDVATGVLRSNVFATAWSGQRDRLGTGVGTTAGSHWLRRR